MLLACLAWLVVALVPFRVWSARVGDRPGDLADATAARRLAAQVERAAWRMPARIKCLPQAIALSWLLRRRRIAHSVVLAIRPPQARGGTDDLHAWVECAGTIVLGDLPGPWSKVRVLGAGGPRAESEYG